MKYMGSKRRISKYILPIMLKNRTKSQYYVEPFCGGCNSLEKVTGKRIAGDVDSYLIMMFQRLQIGWKPPRLITEEFYNYIKNNMRNVEPELVGYVGYAMSFGGKFFGGYRRDKKGDHSLHNMVTQSRRSFEDLMRQKPLLAGVEFHCVSYENLTIPPKSIIYCDIPYKGVTKYKTNDFDHGNFFEWCRLMHKQGHAIFVSEYNAPADFTCVWSKEVTTGLDVNTTKKDVEKLFTLKGEI